MKKGFTLIELLVVVAVLSILTVAVLTILNPIEQIKKSHDAQRKNDLAQLQRMLDAYYNDNNRYPAATARSYQISGAAWGDPWNPYGRLVPKDPLSPTQDYAYTVASDGGWYKIYTKLERGANDLQYCGGCGPDGVYHYGVSSSNVLP